MSWFSKEKMGTIAPLCSVGLDDLVLGLPHKKDLLQDTPILALDLEMTGLDAGKDRILSFGFIPIHGGEVQIGGAQHFVVRADVGENDAAVIHGIGHDDVASGVLIDDALKGFCTALKGHVLLAHHVGIECSFLGQALAKIGVKGAGWPVICTQKIEAARIARSGGVKPSLRLGDARARYGLPQYKAHNALTDALSAAELFLAQLAHGDRGPKSLIRPYISIKTLV